MRILIVIFVSLITLSACAFDRVEKPIDSQPEIDQALKNQSNESAPEASADLNLASQDLNLASQDSAESASQDIESTEPAPQPAGNPASSSNEPPIKLPATFNHEMDFASQAPYGNWDLPYQEACEEASLITVSRYFDQQPINQSVMDYEIKKLVDWEKQNLGLYTDTNAAEVVKIAKEYFGLQAWLVEEVTEERIKQELVKGNLIIAPFAGRELNNPNFTAPGPIYHMLVIRGYDRNQFITNDVGTRKGKEYKYHYQTLIKAVHDLPNYDTGAVFRPYDDNTLSDWDKNQKMLTGKPVMIVLRK